VCVLNSGSKSVADSLSSYVSGGACNEEIAGCGLPPVDDLCASCAATYRECTADATGLTCGSCLDGYQEVGGVCVEVEDCGGGCGPGGACDEVTGLCDCLPGHAYVGGAPCQPVLWLNEWAEVVAEDEVATFKQGSDNFGAQYGPCHQVSIAYQYYMLKYEVTRAEYRLCVEEGPCSAPVCGDMPGFPEVDLESVHYANHPVICVDKAAAAAYCNWIGGRLPSESEWEYAAGAPLLACPAGWWYPWQSSTISGAYANYSNQPNPFQSLDLPYDMNGGPTTPVGFFDGSLRTREQSGWVGGPDTFQTQSNASPFGVFDLPGNVAEWALDSWHDDYSVGAPVDGSAWLDQGSPMGVKRGEGWPDDGKALSTFFRGPKAKAETLTYMGIRCVYSK
jgi:formylglycine-generating enzyme required for sulfatase activity